MEFIFSIGVNFDRVFTGGVVVSHKLCYELAKRGYKVTIFTDPEYPHPNISVQKNSDENNLNFEYDSEKTVIIPSFNWKNNTKIKNVVRWALYHIEKDSISNVEETDEIFNFGTFNLPLSKQQRKLTLFNYNEDILFNRKLNRNKKYCHILLKNNPPCAKEIVQHFNSFSLDDYKNRGCFNYLADKFNEYEYFLTFDDKTFLTTAAAMCGCIPIILKNNQISPIIYREQNPIQSIGVAYGIDDLDWAKNTIGFVSEHINFLIEKDNETIDSFINFWKNKLEKK